MFLQGAEAIMKANEIARLKKIRDTQDTLDKFKKAIDILENDRNSVS